MSVLLERGLIIDGSGDAARIGDVLLSDGCIEAVGEGLPAHGTRRIDCRGKVVSPGFIDVHTHDDAIVLRDPECLPKVSQGVTTVIVGNCGISLSPLRTSEPQPPLNLLGNDSFQFDGFAAYARAIDAAQPAVNVAALIGHTTLRFATMTELTRAATPDELSRMGELLEAAMCDGAFGMSSGLFYEPAFPAPASEVTALARIVARHGGVYTSHLRDEMGTILEAMVEAADCALDAGLPLVISHHKCAGPANWGRTKETLPLLDMLASRQPLALDVYPYLAGSTVLREDLVDGVIDVMVTWSDAYPQMSGRMLADIATEWNVDQREACRRLQPGGACYFQMAEEDVDRVITHRLTMIGSDGLPHDRHPHPRLWGAFPRVLARYWRERGLLTLEQAVHKMTGLSAAQFRISRRGLLREGYHADVVVFDPQRVEDTAGYDRPISAARGIEAVFVNGELAYDGRSPRTVARAGRWLQRTMDR